MANEANARLVKQAAYASMCVAGVLLLSKLVVWSLSDSTSVLSSMLDSLMDIVASLVNFFAIRYALMPADEDHPFGHSKAEGIAALLQAAFICGSVTMLLLHVADRLLNPQALAAIPESIAVMAFSTLLTTALVLYQRWVHRKTGSLAVKADSAHYASDILTNVAVIGA
ncbi:MAG: cation diffusion facilitator family transporter, partial [Pseudomonadota bacterium]